MASGRKYGPGVTGKLRLWLLNFFLVFLFALSLQYFKIEIFNKEKNIQFSGNFFYNPYENYTVNTLKANFHAHSNVWYHITSGAQRSEEVYRYYKSKGYDIISLSNYQKITFDKSDSDYIPVYEHGYNLRKSHQLVINSGRTVSFDFSLFPGYNTKQQVINRLKKEGGLIALAHPAIRNGYRPEEMKYLKGYDFIEVFNTSVISSGIWDAALSNGYPAWILSNDDCHDIKKPELSIICWNRISVKKRTKYDILNALKQGCSYGVMNKNHEELNFLDSCTVKNGIIKVSFSKKADLISFVADRGKMRKEVHNQASATYKIGEEDSYVRIEARNGTQLIYLNPVIRYNGFQLNNNNEFPPVNVALTILSRTVAMVISIFILLLILVINRINVFPFHTGRFIFASMT